MKNNIFSATLFLVASSSVFASPSTFQKSCTDISYGQDFSGPYIEAICKDVSGRANSARLDLKGIMNLEGTLVSQGGVGSSIPSSFHRSCSGMEVVLVGDFVVLKGECRDSGRTSYNTSIEVSNVENRNGRLVVRGS